MENKEQLNCQFSWKDQFGSVDGCWKDEEETVFVKIMTLSLSCYVYTMRYADLSIHYYNLIYIYIYQAGECDSHCVV